MNRNYFWEIVRRETYMGHRIRLIYLSIRSQNFPGCKEIWIEWRGDRSVNYFWEPRRKSFPRGNRELEEMLGGVHWASGGICWKIKYPMTKLKLLSLISDQITFQISLYSLKHINFLWFPVLLFTLTIYKISMLLSIHHYMCVRRMHLE